MNNLLRIVAGVIDLLVARGKRKEQESAQAEADHSADDPAGWFATHFRVRPAAGDTDAKGSSETNTERR